MNTASPTLPIAPAYFIGTQEGLPASPARAAVGDMPARPARPAIPSFDLYNLTAPLGELHPAGSTVSAQTLIDHGFTLPPKTLAKLR